MIATRDMKKAEFRAALARRGWKQELLWVVGTSKDGHSTGIGMVLSRQRGRWQTNYRATLAKAIRELQEVE